MTSENINTRQLLSSKFAVLLSFLLLATGCDPGKVKELTAATHSFDPRTIVLIPERGDSPLEKQIARAQEKVRTAKEPAAALEQLGWLFVTKARTSFDPGYYKLAEQCALAMQAAASNSPEALLLRGHVLQSLHRFKEAEALARELVMIRGRSFDYGLLGDVLMEQGRLDESIVAYQTMADLKPDLHAYTRAAHVRWLKGDSDGAIEMMELAVSAATPRDAESAAWVYSRMAWYRWQTGEPESALRYCEAAIQLQSDYPPALLIRGRIELARRKMSDAIRSLTLAASLNPLPEYQWTLADALREAGQVEEALAIELKLSQTGAANDPRTFALFLATRGQDAATALRLARAEIDIRADIFTHDAIAWALAASGRWDEAAARMQQALAEGTGDARLFLHAAIIASHSARQWDAIGYLNKAASRQQTLLPSEKRLLESYSILLAHRGS